MPNNKYGKKKVYNSQNNDWNKMTATPHRAWSNKVLPILSIATQLPKKQTNEARRREEDLETAKQKENQPAIRFDHVQ